jgi:acetoin utilization deacetylase AcuC-like enzyme
VTESLQKIANCSAEGRVISVLEGGYNVKLGNQSPLAQSVAAHVRALVTTHSGGISLEPKWIAE